MPIYEYKCLKCGEQFEIMLRFNDQSPKSCPICKGEVKKLISNTSFILKGTGWYVTDYASPERKKALEAERGSNGKEYTPSKVSTTDKQNTKAEVSSSEVAKTTHTTK